MYRDNEIRRIGLYLLMKAMPMGSSIFSFKLSRKEIIMQVVPAFVAVIIAILWAFIFAEVWCSNEVNCL